VRKVKWGAPNRMSRPTQLLFKTKVTTAPTPLSSPRHTTTPTPVTIVAPLRSRRRHYRSPPEASPEAT